MYTYIFIPFTKVFNKTKKSNIFKKVNDIKYLENEEVLINEKKIACYPYDSTILAINRL